MTISAVAIRGPDLSRSVKEWPSRATGTCRGSDCCNKCAVLLCSRSGRMPQLSRFICCTMSRGSYQTFPKPLEPVKAVRPIALCCAFAIEAFLAFWSTLCTHCMKSSFWEGFTLHCSLAVLCAKHVCSSCYVSAIHIYIYVLCVYIYNVYIYIMYIYIYCACLLYPFV